jgi:hypothetical protein
LGCRFGIVLTGYGDNCSHNQEEISNQVSDDHNLFSLGYSINIFQPKYTDFNLEHLFYLAISMAVAGRMTLNKINSDLYIALRGRDDIEDGIMMGLLMIFVWIVIVLRHHYIQYFRLEKRKVESN